ncbi:MAG: thiamine pyrophosphate-binding protein, partial [Halomonadaceae bacterium]
MGRHPHGGVIVARHLQQAGATHLFTLCGGHISPILVEAVNHGLTVVDVRHEAAAVFAADAHCRLTGRPGVAVVTAGPGVTNAITAVKNAQMAQSPVIIIGGAAPTLLRNRGALQDINQLALMHSVVKWQTRAKTLSQLDDALFYGLSIARSGIPGPVFIEAPIDLLYPRELVQTMFADQSGLQQLNGVTRWTLKAFLSSYLWRQESLPSFSLRREASRLHQPLEDWRGGGQAAEAGNQLARARRPMLLIGSQALVNRNPAQAQQLADTVTELGIPVWTTGMARGLLGADHPLLFRHHRSDALKEADMVIVAGMPF